MNKKMLNERMFIKTHVVGPDGKNHYGIKNIQRWVEEHTVIGVASQIAQVKDAAGNPLEMFSVMFKLHESPNDLQINIPVASIGPVVKHLMEIASNFTFVAHNLKLDS